MLIRFLLGVFPQLLSFYFFLSLFIFHQRFFVLLSRYFFLVPELLHISISFKILIIGLVLGLGLS